MNRRSRKRQHILWHNISKNTSTKTKYIEGKIHINFIIYPHALRMHKHKIVSVFFLEDRKEKFFSLSFVIYISIIMTNVMMGRFFLYKMVKKKFLPLRFMMVNRQQKSLSNKRQTSSTLSKLGFSPPIDCNFYASHWNKQDKLVDTNSISIVTNLDLNLESGDRFNT